MNQSLRSRGRVARLVVAVGLAGLICAVTPARGQQGQNPTQGPTTPRFFIGLPVNSDNEKHKDAVAKAKEYLESLKGDAKAQEVVPSPI